MRAATAELRRITAAAAERLAVVEVVHVAVPLLEPFEAAHGTETDREVVLVRAVGADGEEGWGECDALSAPGYSPEWAAGAYTALATDLGPRLLAGGVAALGAAGGTGADRRQPMAMAGLLGALVDLGLRRSGRSLAEVLGVGVVDVPAATVIGRRPDLDGLVAAVAAAVAAGAPLVKCKVAPGWCAEPLAAVRAAFPDLRLAADANGSFDLAGARAALAVAAEVDLAYLEQPLPPTADGALADLLAAADVPVALDESIAGPADVDRLAASGVALVNVKPARLGGVAAALDTVAAADRAGLGRFVGGMLELGVGRAAAVTLAAAVGGGWPTDVGPSARYVADDVATEVVTAVPGTVRVPAGPGIGVEVRPARVDEVARARALVER